MIIQGELQIHTNQRGPVLSDLFGIFFEDINHATDGGLYAELVRNRSFEFDPIDNADYHSLTAWSEVNRGGKAEMKVEEEVPLNARNTRYLSIHIVDAGRGVGIMNEGCIGNEEVDMEFFERYPYFHNAIKEKYPDMKVISSSGSNSEGDDYEEAGRNLEKQMQIFVLFAV